MNFTDRSQIQLMIVDDEEDFREAAAAYFRKLGYQVVEAADGQQALRISRERSIDVAIIDLHMPNLSGIELLKSLREQECELQAIMLTGGGTIENAVESMRHGAFDFLTKPAKLNEIDVAIQRAFRAKKLEQENQQLRQFIKNVTPNSEMIGQSAAMVEVNRLIDKTAVTDKPVLIEGESGTGKELVARAIHKRSPLCNQPLVVINCAALPEPLLESELFGHEKGAFTGAVAAKPGLFEIADGGTLFIDEIGELAGSLQAKLLRVLEDGVLRRVGSVKERKVKVRLIAATNRDLRAEVARGNFREDLLYRINVLALRLPPLRERGSDIRLLVKHFVGPDWQIEDDLVDALCEYDWPGNIRQLQNAIERAKILSDGNQIRREDLPSEVVGGASMATVRHSESSNGLDLESLNRIHVEQVYRQYQGNKTHTAKALGIGRRSLYRLLDKYHIK